MRLEAQYSKKIPIKSKATTITLTKVPNLRSYLKDADYGVEIVLKDKQ